LYGRSVDGSYAGQKGKARNVGVIAVAIFEEQATQLVEPPAPPPTDRPYNWSDDLDARSGTGAAAKERVARAEKPAAKRAAAADAPVAPSTTSAPPMGGARPMPSQPSPVMRPPAPPHRISKDEDSGYSQRETQEPTNRPGLGTEYGEQRYSAASYTKFVRSGDRPVAIAELRYNDAAGLMALGIQVQALPSEGEIMVRETADPFPGDSHFSHAP